MCSIVHITGFEFGGVFLMLSEKNVMHRENRVSGFFRWVEKMSRV